MAGLLFNNFLVIAVGAIRGIEGTILRGGVGIDLRRVLDSAGAAGPRLSLRFALISPHSFFSFCREAECERKVRAGSL
jgi:hypothetical protein